jgi:hypothetical protein
MKHLFDPEMLAPDVMRVAIDPLIADSFADLATHEVPPGFHVERPLWKSDIEWISAAEEASFVRFEEAFQALDVARHVLPYVDIDREVRMYQGFVVLRSECREPDFHVDWRDAGNQAFTLLTPIGDPVPGFGLVYKTVKGETRAYDYRRGEALLFGDNFFHSTQPGRSTRPTALLSFNLGTDRMEHWPAIRKTAGVQGGIVRRPDGVLE